MVHQYVSDHLSLLLNLYVNNLFSFLTPQGTETNKNKSWLLRLFESKLFDSSMAISYMFNSKEPGVLDYIGNRLFTYPDDEIDFFLPQVT